MIASLWQWLLALDLKWKLGLGALGLYLFSPSLGGANLPGDIEEGVRLAGLQLQGEKPLYQEGGIEVLEVEGTWVKVRLGENEATDRWFNFEYVAGYMPASDKD
ncbi:MAG: hypothetical protein AAF682_07200 [Planctomycetota bacterium]